MDHNWIDLKGDEQYMYDVWQWKIYECCNCQSYKAIRLSENKILYKVDDMKAWTNFIPKCSEIIMEQILE